MSDLRTRVRASIGTALADLAIEHNAEWKMPVSEAIAFAAARAALEAAEAVFDDDCADPAMRCSVGSRIRALRNLL